MADPNYDRNVAEAGTAFEFRQLAISSTASHSFANPKTCSIVYWDEIKKMFYPR